MKKALAIILGASIVLSCTACKRKDDNDGTRTTRESHTKVTTEETDDTEPTDDPTETSADPTETTDETESETTKDETTAAPTSESTSESSDTDTTGSTIPADSGKPVSLQGEIYRVRRSFVVRDKNSDTGASIVANMDCPFLYFGNADYRSFQADLFNDVFEPLTEQKREKHDAAEEAIKKAVASGDTPSSATNRYSIDRFRMDSRVVSFSIFDDGETSVYNYDMRTYTELSIDDVIKDRSAFAKVVEAKIAASALGDSIASQVASEMKDGESSFGITYDGIFFPNPDEDSSVAWIKIPVTGNENLVNMDYFGETPDTFTLIFDVDQTLAWDVNGDAKAETFSVAFEETQKPGYDFTTGKLVIKINGEAFEFMDLDINDITTNYRRAFLLFDGEDYYLYCTCSAVEGYEDTYVFRITDELTPVYSCMVDAFIDDHYFIDPTYMTLYYRSFMLTCHLWYMNCSAIGSNGVPEPLSDNYYAYEPGIICKKELPCFVVDAHGTPTNMDTTVPAESMFSIVGYYPDTGDLILEEITADGESGDRFKFKVTFDEEENMYVGGILDSEAFYDVLQMW